MGLKEEISNKVEQILDKEFLVRQVDYVPEIDDKDLVLDGDGLEFPSTVLCIDMRDSTEILNKNNAQTIARLHKAYLHTTVSITKSLGGEVRSFNGDSIICFFPGAYKKVVSNAVKAAMQICYMITNSTSGIHNLLSEFSAINFGIGLDYGNVLSTKVGIGGKTNANDLIWIGNPVNRSVTISDECSTPFYIGISNSVYINLLDEVKFHKQKNSLTGLEESINMWAAYSVRYNGRLETCYKTSYLWKL